MNLYLDDDVASRLLRRLLEEARHNVQVPADIGFVGADDAIHLTHAIREQRILLSGNHDDFENLHDLVIESGGHHCGMLIVCRENNPKRDLTPKGIAVAVNRIESAGVDMQDCFYILNEWR